MGFAKSVLSGIVVLGAVVGVAYTASKIIREKDLPELSKKAINGVGDLVKSTLKSDSDKAVIDVVATASNMAIDVMDYETRR